jgi:CRP-like cAMP-binding protein
MEGLDTYVRRYGLDCLLSPGLAASLGLRRYAKDEHIIVSGQKVEGLLFFVEGRAKVYSQMENGSSLLVRFYFPFDILGDVELFSFESFILNVVALEETACIFLPAAEIRRHAADNTALLMELCRRLGRKLADFNASAAVNLRYPVENRLASYLLAVSDSGGQCLVTDDLGELADILGTSYRQLARVVRRFREEGILESRRGAIRVASREKLMPLARDLYSPGS